MSYPDFVEAKDVRFFEVKAIRDEESLHLHIAGLVFHSALAVERVEIRNDGPNAWVMVKLTPAAKGLSGKFKVDVPMRLPEETVLFGPTKVKIWPINPR